MSKHTLLHISSKDRASGESTSNFHVTLGRMGLSNVKSIVLKHASIPNTIYNISTENNTFTYAIAGTPYSTTIVPGQYTFANLKQVLETALVGIGFSMSLYSFSSRILFETTTDIQYLTKDQGNPMGDVLGLTVGTSVDVGSYTGASMVSLGGTQNIIVESRTLAEANLIKSNESKVHALAVVPMRAEFGFTEHYSTGHAEIDDVDSLSQRHGKSIQSIDIKLIDAMTNKIVDLNGHHVSIVLKIYS